MLISGRDEMEKSLNSLLYFKNAFPTEIILVDTGCNAEQRALAEKYADKIIDFIWCDDFAAARNTGLNEAQGEWFMYLDDDEWFDNPQEIITFFQTKEHEKYNSASYIVKNYTDLEGKGYVLSYPSRMVKREKGTKFIGKIHEYIQPFRGPKRVFNDFVHHYGYVYKDYETMQEHRQRNIKPLLDMRKECPGDPRWMIQLAQEYFIADEYDTEVNVCTEGMKEWEAMKGSVSYYPIHVGALYGFLIMGLERLHRYQEEEIWIERALNDPLMKINTMKLCQTFYYMEGARLYAYNGEEKCLKYLKKYIHDIKSYSNDANTLEQGTVAILTSAFQSQLISETMMICLKEAVLVQENQLIEEMLGLIDWKIRDRFFRNKEAKEIIDACCRREYCTLFERIAVEFADGDQGMHEMHFVFRELQKEYEDKGRTDLLYNLRQLVSKINSNHFYIIGTRIIWEEKTEHNTEKIMSEYDVLFTKCQNQILEVEDEVWEIATREQVNVEDLLLKIDYRIWRRSLERMEQLALVEDWDKWNERIEKWKTKEDIRYTLFFIKYIEKCLATKNIGKIGLTQFEEKIWVYANLVVQFYKPYYKEEVLTENAIVLPDELQLALTLDKLHEFRKEKQNAEALECMKKCLGIYPNLDKTMIAYAAMLRDEVQRQEVEADTAKKELQQMITYLKTLAQTRMERGEADIAKAILEQVVQYAPEDKEIKSLLAQL